MTTRHLGSGLLTLLALAVVVPLAVLTGPTTNTAFADATSTSSFIGSADAFAPAIMADASWWLDASDHATLFTDTACTVAASETTTVPISCWADKLTSSQTVTGSAQVVPSSLGGNSVVRFLPTNSLGGPDVFGGELYDMTLFFVSRENAVSANLLLNLNGGDAGSNRFSVHAPWNTNRVWFFDAGSCCYSNRVQSTVNATALGDAALFAGWKNTAANHNYMRLNRGVTYQSPENQHGTTTGGLVLFGDGDVVSHDIAEVVVFDTLLSAADISAVEAYLESKWGL